MRGIFYTYWKQVVQFDLLSFCFLCLLITPFSLYGDAPRAHLEIQAYVSQILSMDAQRSVVEFDESISKSVVSQYEEIKVYAGYQRGYSLSLYRERPTYSSTYKGAPYSVFLAQNPYVSNAFLPVTLDGSYQFFEGGKQPSTHRIRVESLLNHAEKRGFQETLIVTMKSI